MCAPPLVPGSSRQRGTTIPLRSKLEILRIASAPSTRVLTDDRVHFGSGRFLDRINFGPRQRRQAPPHLPPKSLYIRATTGQMTASAWWLRQHSKAHHLRPHRREVNLLLPLRRYCGAYRSKSDLLSLWNNYNLRASQCRVCMPAMAIRHKALSLL